MLSKSEAPGPRLGGSGVGGGYVSAAAVTAGGQAAAVAGVVRRRVGELGAGGCDEKAGGDATMCKGR